MTYKHIGKNFTPPDIEAKVTGAARYAEDFKKEGMVFARLLTSPLPAGRIISIDTSEAEAMEGVVGILTTADLPQPPPPANPALASDHITYIGQPLLAVAAVTEEIAENAIEKIRIEFERRPFVTDPLDTLVEGGPNPYPTGNTLIRNAGEAAAGTTAAGTDVGEIKWSRDAMNAFRAGREPSGVTFGDEWSYGDIESEFAQCTTIVEEPFVTIGQPHHALEPRTGMAYWENGRCYFHGSLQSHTIAVAPLAGMLGIDPANLVFINEYTGGGFGGKIFPYPIMAVTGHLARKINRPVQLRITREEEFYIGSARAGMQGWIKLGLKPNGEVGAVDTVIVGDAGSGGGASGSSAAEHITLMLQPAAMRFRGVSIYTNTTPRGAQRGPGQNEMAAVLAPIYDKAIRQAGLDRMEVRRLNAPVSEDKIGPRRGDLTSAFFPQAIQMGADMFNWSERSQRSGQRNGSKVTGIGIGMGYHSAGASGYDGLCRIGTDGKLYLHTGVGNLGTYSYAAVVRTAAEVLKVDWDNCEIVRGNTDLHLPYSTYQAGSNTMFTEVRTNYVAAQDALRKLKAIAAADLGGNADDYDIDGQRVFLTSNPEQGMTYAEAAQRAVAMGGEYSGQEFPEELNDVTKRAVQGLAGSGLIGVAKDSRHSGTVPAMTIGFMEIEMDLDTGKYDIVDYTCVADCGTIIHPLGFRQGMNGGGVWGVGLSGYERHVYDPQNGLPANVGLYQARIPSYLDVPHVSNSAGLDIPDPQSPMGSRGVGEPAQGCAAAALASAITDALGGQHLFNRAPITPDMIVNHVAQLDQYNTGELKTNTF
ncbi:molybdopterin-dependent oxidoreductase [Pseudohongiella sp. SYSU M77423]|uniref:xanthine dehydrogenase family protein molybdopterin-binding subunit n=1 Tax=Pseudohongiella sp. SYSU M77423 TaxID=3042312 RepID=UPI0024801A7F|nr:molybdopterin cofactor-binding domain-containing protein [Pseudohongiella sp. SYSU M77423]MDH7944514.1 molybdopterin-dependent oxidoreductase [Pseudohongiella sp. SYSU M77423]